MTISPLLNGPRIRLGAFMPGDAAIFQRWYLDTEFARLLDTTPAAPKSENRLLRWLDEQERERDNYIFAIRTLDIDQLIGFVQLDSIAWSHGSGWLAIGIGEPLYRGTGYGYEAMSLVLQFGFHELNLHRIQLTVFSYNDPAIRLYERLGFRREGVFREAIHRDGQRHDMLLYGMLRPEWEADR